MAIDLRLSPSSALLASIACVKYGICKISATRHSRRPATHKNARVGFADKVCTLRFQVWEYLIEGFEPIVEVGGDLGIRSSLITPVRVSCPHRLIDVHHIRQLGP